VNGLVGGSRQGCGGPYEGVPGYYLFDPLSEMPRMRLRWTIMKTTIIGSVKITEPAINMSHAVRFG
jgi:hypothetical protein